MIVEGQVNRYGFANDELPRLMCKTKFPTTVGSRRHDEIHTTLIRHPGRAVRKRPRSVVGVRAAFPVSNLD